MTGLEKSILRTLERAAWHEERAEQSLEKLQAHRFARKVFVAFGGGEHRDEMEEGFVADVERSLALAAFERAGAERLKAAA